MVKPQIRLVSNFAAARRAGDDAIAELVSKATDAMEDTAKSRLDKAAGQRGYELSGSDIDKTVSAKDGKIEYGQWYGRFFEYGTVHIQALSFMRPGYRAGRKLVKNEAPEIFEGWVRRKARVR